MMMQLVLQYIDLGLSISKLLNPLELVGRCIQRTMFNLFDKLKVYHNIMKNLHLLSNLERYYLQQGTLRAFFKRRKLDYMIKVIFGE